MDQKYTSFDVDKHMHDKLQKVLTWVGIQCIGLNLHLEILVSCLFELDPK